MVVDNLPPWLSDPASLHVGQTVFHLGKPDDPWIIEKLGGGYAWVAQGKGKDASRCQLPVGSLAVIPTPALVELTESVKTGGAGSPVSGAPLEKTTRPAPAPAPARKERAPAPRDVGDAIAQLLTASPEVGPWRILELSNCGLDPKEVQAKIGHLSNGLQRMGIGNRLRIAWKAGHFNPEALTARIKEGLR